MARVRYLFFLFTSFFQAEAITVLHDSNLETNSSQSGGLCNNKNLDMLCNKHLENSTTISTTTKSKCLLIFWNLKYDYLLEFIWFQNLYCLKFKLSLQLLRKYRNSSNKMVYVKTDFKLLRRFFETEKPFFVSD